MTTHANNENQNSTYRQVLAIPSFRALWFGQICSQLAVNTLLFVLALRIYNTTNSNTAVSGLFLAYGIPAVLVRTYCGHGGRPAGQTESPNPLRYRPCVFCHRTVVCFSSGIYGVYPDVFKCSCLHSFMFLLKLRSFRKLYPSNLLVSANSLFSFTYYSSLAIGTIFAGPLLRFFGSYGVFVFISLLFLCCLVFVFEDPFTKLLGRSDFELYWDITPGMSYADLRKSY